MKRIQNVFSEFEKDSIKIIFWMTDYSEAVKKYFLWQDLKICLRSLNLHELSSTSWIIDISITDTSSEKYEEFEEHYALKLVFKTRKWDIIKVH